MFFQRWERRHELFSSQKSKTLVNTMRRLYLIPSSVPSGYERTVESYVVIVIISGIVIVVIVIVIVIIIIIVIIISVESPHGLRLV